MTDSMPYTGALDLHLDPGQQPRTSAQFAYEVLRRSIMRGVLKPGTRLTQSEVSRQMSLSSTPVREALRRLESEGLVRIDVHRGAVVRGLAIDELKEIYELRLLLEPLAARKAASNITPEELDLAESLWVRMNELVANEESWERMNESDDIQAWSEANHDFHAVFARAARSPNLMRILNGLRDSSSPYVRWSIVEHPGFVAKANQQHRELLDACRNGDPDLAARIEAEHLQSTLTGVLEVAPDSTAPTSR
ncbi:MAG TPA: GntR family transcriptional regulator [Nocardioidaceae bacterium]|nr:GntR family transcriptional regulator [Nocardioidaceae bacterium]